MKQCFDLLTECLIDATFRSFTINKNTLFFTTTLNCTASSLKQQSAGRHVAPLTLNWTASSLKQQSVGRHVAPLTLNWTASSLKQQSAGRHVAPLTLNSTGSKSTSLCSFSLVL